MKTTTILIVLLMSIAISDASAKTWVVRSNADAGTYSLRTMLTRAGDGDNITFALPTGYEVITLNSEITIAGKSVIIDGRNMEPGSGIEVTIQVREPGKSPYRVFTLDPGFQRSVTLRNMNLRGGDVSALSTTANGDASSSGTMADGGVILLRLDGALTLSRCVVREGRARNGGGVYAGGVFNRGALIIQDCDITRNEAVSTTEESCGGGIYSSFGTTILSSTRIYENISQTHSGGFYIFNATGRITSSSIYGNSVRDGAANEGSFCGPSLLITQSFITNVSSSTIAEKYSRQAVSLAKPDKTLKPNAKDKRGESVLEVPQTLALLPLSALQP